MKFTALPAFILAVSSAAVQDTISDQAFTGPRIITANGIISLWPYLGDFVSPLSNCGDSSKFDVKELVLTPYPVLSGENLNVYVKGNLKTDITDGAKIDIAIKKLGIQVVHENLDYCTETAKDNNPCPIKAGQDRHLTINYGITSKAPQTKVA
jgi:hypothetical protein